MTANERGRRWAGAMLPSAPRKRDQVENRSPRQTRASGINGNQNCIASNRNPIAVSPDARDAATMGARRNRVFRVMKNPKVTVPRYGPRSARVAALDRGPRRRLTMAVLDSRTVQSTRESGNRAGWDGAKRKRGSRIHLAVDTLGHLLGRCTSPCQCPGSAQVGAWAVAEATWDAVTIALVDEGSTGDKPVAAFACLTVRRLVILAAQRP